jgi:vacuolar-type H+-ATPase subunit I/STV1
MMTMKMQQHQSDPQAAEETRLHSKRCTQPATHYSLTNWVVAIFAWIGIIGILFVLAILFSAKALVAIVKLLHFMSGK